MAILFYANKNHKMLSPKWRILRYLFVHFYVHKFQNV